MVEITRSAACKNSPRNAAAQEIAIKLLTGDRAALSDVLSPQATVRIVGKQDLEGRDCILNDLARWIEPLTAVHIDNAISHGRVGAVNGTTASDGHSRDFAMIIEFVTTKAEAVGTIRLYRP